MGVFGRVNGEWVESAPFIRDGGAWSSDGDQLWARDASEWKLIWPDGDDTLVPPANLVAVPAQDAVTLTWTDPTQTTTPTHVQVRIPETTPVWTEYIYGTTTVLFSALDPSTNYQGQVRYVKRSEVDGQVELTSAITTKFFTTLALSGPGIPAADPGGSGGDSIIYWGDTVGTPGVVGGSDCWWEYTIQEFDSDAYTWADSSAIANVEVNGDIESLTYNWVDEGFACDQVLRWKYREVCDSVPGDWQYGSAWTVVCDFDDPCGGFGTNADFANAPWTDPDAVFAGFQICRVDNKTVVEDALDSTGPAVYGKLPAYHLPLYIESAWEIRALDDLNIHGEPLLAGRVPGLVPLGSSIPSLTSDFTFSMGVYVDQQPTTTVKIAQIADTVRIYMVPSGAGVTMTAIFGKEGSGLFNLASSTELALDEWHTVGVTIDQDGDKILYVDGAADVTDADTTRVDFSGMTGNVEYYANDRMRIRKAGAWGRVLTADEMNFVHIPKLYPYYINSQYEAVTPAASSYTFSSFPSGSKAGDLLVLSVLAGRNTTTNDVAMDTPPTGFTLIDKTYRAGLYYRILDGTTDPATATVNFDAAAGLDPVAFAVVYRNVDQTNPFFTAAELIENAVYTGNSLSVLSGNAPECDVNSSQTGQTQWSDWWEGKSMVGTGLRYNDAVFTDLGTGYQAGGLTGDRVEGVAATPNYEAFSWEAEGIVENALVEEGNRFAWSSATAHRGYITTLVLQAPKPAVVKPEVVQFKQSYFSGTAARTATDIMPIDMIEDDTNAIWVFVECSRHLEEIDVTADTWLNKVGANTYWAPVSSVGANTFTNLTAGDHYWQAFIIDNVDTTEAFYDFWEMIGASASNRAATDSIGVPAPVKVTSTDQAVFAVHDDRHADTADYVFVASADVDLDYGWQEYIISGGSDRELTFHMGRPNTTGIIDSMTATLGITPSVVRAERFYTLNPPGTSTKFTPATAPSFVSASTPAIWPYSSSTSQTINMPSSFSAGDLLVICLIGNSSANLEGATSQGFKYKGHQGISGSVHQFWEKISDGTETSFSKTFGGSTSCVVFAFSNATAMHPASGVTITQATSPTTAPGITPTTPEDDMGIIRTGRNISNAASAMVFTVGSAMSGHKQDNFTDSWEQFYFEAKATAGAITAGTWTPTPDTGSVVLDAYFVRGV